MAFEFLRRVQREVEMWNRQQDQNGSRRNAAARVVGYGTNESPGSERNAGVEELAKGGVKTRLTQRFETLAMKRRLKGSRLSMLRRQILRSMLHMVQFGVA